MRRNFLIACLQFFPWRLRVLPPPAFFQRVRRRAVPASLLQWISGTRPFISWIVCSASQQTRAKVYAARNQEAFLAAGWRTVILGAFRAEGNGEGIGQTDAGMHGGNGRSREVCYRNSPLRSAIVQARPLIVARMGNDGIIGRHAANVRRNAADDHKSRESGKNHDDPYPSRWPQRAKEDRGQNPGLVCSLHHASRASPIILLRCQFSILGAKKALQSSLISVQLPISVHLLKPTKVSRYALAVLASSAPETGSVRLRFSGCTIGL